MLPLFLSILASVSLFIIFRFFTKFQVNTFQAVTINYIVCIITGLIFVDKTELQAFNPSNWWGMALFLGTMFISTFYLMGITTQKVGVTVATLANKMSMVIPVLFSLLVFKSTKDFDWLNSLGLICAIFSIILSNYTPNKKENIILKDNNNNQEITIVETNKTNIKLILPIAIFFLGGIIDTSITYSNLYLIQKGEEGIFPIALFTTAATVGSVIVAYNMIFKKEKIELKTVYAGIILGIPNYFSIYFLLKALTAFEGNGAFVMPVLSIGIIVIASVISAVFLGDKLNKINILGVIVAILAIILLSYQKIV
jgi:drug/metabolite transporter (DMT)-like permease